MGLIPGLGRFPGRGNGNPLQYLPMDRISCGQRSMVGYSPWVVRVRQDLAIKQQQQIIVVGNRFLKWKPKANQVLSSPMYQLRFP